MQVYRISKAEHARELSGRGAELYGGRWNHKQTPVVYTAQSRALAGLEYLVNLDAPVAPADLKLITIDIPDVGITEISQRDLPQNWRISPAPSATKDFGTALLQSLKSAVYKIPSVIIPEEFNFLLNPLHPDMKKCRIVKVEAFAFDGRLLTEKSARKRNKI